MTQALAKATIQNITQNLTELLRTRYIFPEVAEQLCSLISEKMTTDQYSGAESEKALADLLTQDLQSINQDRHLTVYHSPKRVAAIRSAVGDDRPQDEPEHEDSGFEIVELRDDGIGYIKLNEFADTKYAGDEAVRAMQQLVGAKALIFDLRDNGGGSPKMVQLLTTYLFGHEPVHLNDLYMRETDTTDQFWILPYVPGERFEDAAVYILTSPETFSAAEEFCFDLQNLKRATIIGETTGGGAHLGDDHVLSDELCVFISHGKAINPISGTNWEGTGVQPDVVTPFANALDVALDLAKAQ